MATLGYQRYGLKNWTLNRFDFSTGVSNSITLGLTLSRTSIDNPIYTRTGSEFTLSVSATPPFSLWDGKDYSKMANNDPAKHKWNEYHSGNQKCVHIHHLQSLVNSNQNSCYCNKSRIRNTGALQQG